MAATGAGQRRHCCAHGLTWPRPPMAGAPSPLAAALPPLPPLPPSLSSASGRPNRSARSRAFSASLSFGWASVAAAAGSVPAAAAGSAAASPAGAAPSPASPASAGAAACEQWAQGADSSMQSRPTTAVRAPQLHVSRKVAIGASAARKRLPLRAPALPPPVPQARQVPPRPRHWQLAQPLPPSSPRQAAPLAHLSLPWCPDPATAAGPAAPPP